MPDSSRDRKYIQLKVECACDQRTVTVPFARGWITVPEIRCLDCGYMAIYSADAAVEALAEKAAEEVFRG